jgi:ferric-chelate reductase
VPGFRLHVAVYVTCLCDPEAVPDIPNSVVTVERPDARAMLRAFLAGSDLGPGCGAGSLASVDVVEVGPTKGADAGEKAEAPMLDGAVRGGAAAVCVAGPESLCREAANAVARDGARAGGIGLHCEVYAL